MVDRSTSGQSREPEKPRKQRKRRKMTDERLQNIAVWYCGRFLVSEAKLASYLEQRLRREVADETERDAFRDGIPDLVAKLKRAGYVNDEEAGAAKLRGALRAGYAPKAAARRAALSAQVGDDVIDAAMPDALEQALPDLATEEGDEAPDGADMAHAALKRARRGPYRRGGLDEKTRTRDAGWLQRRGFSHDDIRRALDIADGSGEFET